LHVPPQYDGASALPMVLNFHGYGSTASRQAPYSRLPALADEEGFIVVTPDATGAPAQQWNILSQPDRVDDIAFVGELLDELERTLCVDAARVFAAGISNGSAFSQRLACAMPDRIDAVAAVAAIINPSNCPADARVPLIAFHGTEDACVPFEGGRSGCGPVSLPVTAARTAAANWASHDGCGPVALTQLTEHVEVAAYSECDEEVAVVLYVVEGGGHTWPGSIDVPRLGATTHEIDATALMWEFFVGQGNIR
jgi:polyhydroxybutyrate depolymerase